MWGQAGALEPLTFSSLDNLASCLVVFRPLLFLSVCLPVAFSVLGSPHVKTDLVAGRVCALCVPAVLIAVL